MTELEIRTGEHIAIVGDNASGKTALAKSIAARNNAKYITFRDSYGYSADQSFFMQQRWNLFTLGDDTPTAGDLLSKAAHGASDPDAAFRRLDKLSEILGLKPLLDKYLVTLSSGELRKFQLAKSLLGAPRMLVIDNPYIGLDSRTRMLLTEILASLSKEISIVLELSRPEEIPPFITHVLTVDGGKAVEKITRDEYVVSHFPPEVIRLNHVSIIYGDRIILDDLDWTVRRGEHWALTGENGCGKTTLLSLICADNPQAYACDIELFGRKRGSGETIWDIKRNIGFVSPEMHRAYNTDAPALDVVTAGLFDTEGLFRKPSDEQKRTGLKWMERFGIDGLKGRPFMRLSSGEQRLCLLARAFVKDPPLYILDEPLHGLDGANRLRAKALIGEICGAKGKTLVMVTHYPEEYPYCIDHSLTLQKH